MDVDGAVFETALMLEPEARRMFLERYFRDDPAGLARMTELLEVSGESAAFFLEASQRRSTLADEILAELPANATGAEPPTTEEVGTWIGSYRLVSRIGEGGCGVVYEAEQERPVRRTVALKIIRLGMDTERVIARFEAERQALAMMDHPNIARVYDAGATATGRPYFVMERVTGERITTFCDRERLDIEARIRLFIQVCHAIQHAHQKGVIHRDIKPSNVLVGRTDSEPSPKVIDFGIAKAADRRDAALRGPRTIADQLLGTPPYMSPEQIDMSGIDVDTRTDVYSLGALLYELLGGRAPFDNDALSHAGISEMRRILLEDDPPLLSRMVAALPPTEREAVATARSTDPDRLISRLRGDLDGIAAKAMSKDRNQRYQTVNALAADLARFLADQPVLARPPGRLYLLGKFTRRNRAVCVLGSAVALSLIAGMGVSTWLYVREREARAEQNRLRVEAETARSVESKLRQQAQARANVSQAAVLLSEGRIEEADALLQQNTLMTIEPSREAAGVFRALGNWNAFYERWERAVQYYTLLNQANRLDPPTDIVEGCEVIAISSALLAHGDIPAYNDFRHEMLELYLPATTSHQAEHLLQACLLTPADPWVMERLVDVAHVCEQGLPDPANRPYPDWEAFAMALYYHRLDQPEESLKWAEKCLSYPSSTNDKSGDARLAATRCLKAIACLQLGDRTAAERELREARSQIAEGRETTFDSKPSLAGEWYTWVIARLLFSEARLLLPRVADLPSPHAEAVVKR